MTAAQPRIDAWADEHPTATDEATEAAVRDVLIEHTINPSDESLPPDLAVSFFELDDDGNLASPQD